MEPLREIWKSIFAWKIWVSIGVEDVVGKYRRTILGPLWIVLGQCAYIFGIFLIHRSLQGGDNNNYLTFLSISLPLWTMITGFMNEGCNSFLRSKGYIESYPLPLPIYIIRTVVSNVVTFLHLLPIYVVLAIITHTPANLGAVMAIPGFILSIVFGLGAGLGLASLTARFRDIGAAVAAVMLLLFVVSPVFWEPSEPQKANLVVKLNPFYYLLEVARNPLLGMHVTPGVWAMAVLISLGTLVSGTVVYCVMRPTVVYWL
jgi:ABC-type polysaccharide/polyol phosphate export permease